ncbi:MAG TPA: carboxypeptidase regulatory-like domain-containing protein [Terriglobales bacterium]|nr:carboxypeptidase regulatory-like domain-containing protein [Terriglobales bacterium]
MSPKAVCLLLFTLALFSLGLVAQQPSAPASEAARKTFQISGTVVHAQNGGPLAQTEVSISPVGNRDAFPAPQTMVTGEDGRFLFKNVSPGKYSLVAEHKGFPRQALDEHEYYSTAIAVGPDKVSDNIVFRLLPDGSISGKISDEDGDPVRNGQVMLFEKRVEEGERGIFRRVQTQTDDLGLYHFGHLQPGTYFVVVSAQPWYAQFRLPTVTADNGNAELDRAYPLTYYPAADDPDGASAIAVEPGNQLTADIILRSVPALHLQVANANTDPTQNMQVRLAQKVFGNFGVFVNMQTMRTGSGPMEITGIPPGSYDVNFQTFSQQNAGSNARPASRRQTVKVTRDGELDVANATESAVVTGIVKFEGAEGPPVRASIQLHSRESDEGNGSSIAPDGTFGALTLPPGRYEVFVPNAARFLVKNIAANGARVNGHIIEIKDSSPVQLAVVASKAVGSIEGVVLRGDKPVAGALVVLVPQDSANNRALFRRDQSDSDGTFTLYDVMPGAYTLLAIENGWRLEWTNPVVLKSYLSKGEIVRVEANGKYNIKVKLQ